MTPLGLQTYFLSRNSPRAFFPKLLKKEGRVDGRIGWLVSCLHLSLLAGAWLASSFSPSFFSSF